MNPFPVNEETLALARRLIWFEPPEQALASPVRLMAYLMAYGTAEDIAAAKRYAGEADFLEALDKAPPGIIDARSWSYWNTMAGRYPPPPLPVRKFPE